MPSPDRVPRTRDDLLADVTRRGDHLRLRRRSLIAVSVTAVAAVLVGIPVLVRDTGARRVIAAASSTTVSPAPVDDTTTTPTDAPSTTVAASATTTPTTRPRPTTTTLACRNSANPACGPFRWDPNPGDNAGLEVQISISPIQPRAGQPVTFTITAVDPDAAPVVAGDEGPGACNPPGYGDDPVGRCIAGCLAPEMYGPWTPPPRQRGERKVMYSHTYARAGDYNAMFYFRSGNGPCGYDPYSNDGDTPITVHVSA